MLRAVLCHNLANEITILAVIVQNNVFASAYRRYKSNPRLSETSKTKY